MFKKLDPRVQMLWWLVVSSLALSYQSFAGIGFMIGFTALMWWLSGMGMKFVRFVIKLFPFLIMISVVSLFPSFDLHRSIQMVFRYIVVLGSTMLILTIITYEQMTNALRQLRNKHLPWLDLPLEIFSLVFGISFSSVPITLQEWGRLREIMRSRGVDIDSGSRIQRVKNGLSMVQPLFLRIFKRIEGMAKTLIVSGYDFNVRRTFYKPLKLSKLDRGTMVFLLVFTILSFFLTSRFKV